MANPLTHHVSFRSSSQQHHWLSFPAIQAGQCYFGTHNICLKERAPVPALTLLSRPLIESKRLIRLRPDRVEANPKLPGELRVHLALCYGAV
jgi:hypothetical protein